MNAVPFHVEREVAQLRIPPQSVEAEQAVLGGMMLSGDALHKIVDWLTPGDFYRREHELIYRAILDLAAKGQPFDAVTLGDWFDAQGLGDQVEGGAYLIHLQCTQASAANIVAYAEIVRDKAVLRKLIEVGTGVVNDGFQPDGRDVREIVSAAQRAVAGLGVGAKIGGPKGMKEIGARWFEEIQRRYADDGGMVGLPTPWSRFNALTGGLGDGELVVIAGRPGMGKSAFAVNVATSSALRDRQVLFFNLEMTDVSIYNRAIASIEDVPLEWLRRPQDGDVDHWPKVTEGVRKMNQAALMVDDRPRLRIEQIEAAAKREHMRRPVRLVIVDHMHLIPLPEGSKRNDAALMGEISARLKGLAKTLNCPVVALAQLNRSVEGRQNKRPMMSDLRESGAIEQDADLIAFLYRDDYYAEQEGRASEFPGYVELIVAKQREGQTGKVWLRNALPFGRLDDHEGDAPTRPERQEAAPRGRGFRPRKGWGE